MPAEPSRALEGRVKRILSDTALALALTVQMLPATMTSLPMASCTLSPPVPFPPIPPTSRETSQRLLFEAFRGFAEAAGSLERSYGILRSEVARLSSELEQSNTGLKQSLEENRRMRRHLDRILEGLPCGVLVVKADDTISLINPEAARLLAVETGNNLPSLSALAAFEFLQRARSAAGEHEYRLSEPTGDARWVAVRHAVLEGSGGADTVSVFILRDVSESKRLAAERERLRRERTLAEMSAILAHEIRNPLASLELFAGLLADAGFAPEHRRWVEQVRAGLRTLSATVNNVLHFHSLPLPALVPVDLGQLIEWAGSFLLPMSRQAGIELRVRNGLSDVLVGGDRHRLEQVLLNLVLNAIRATPSGGSIEIAGYATGAGSTGKAEIAVGDSGSGIAPENLTKLFDAGFSARKGRPGLGLLVCKKIVEQHGGSLAAANRPSGGAVFTIVLPSWKSASREDALQQSRPVAEEVISEICGDTRR
jgi:two-component system, sensor histidine kinase FlrB